jgi:hypothetical protein
MNKRNLNTKQNMTRQSYRKSIRPFYKKKIFWSILVLILVVIGIAGGGVYYHTQADSAPKTSNNQTASKKTKIKLKKTTPTKKKSDSSKKDSKKQQNDQKVKDELDKDAKSSDNQQNSGTDNNADKNIKNPGTYDSLTYESDQFTFKISNDVKLVKDADGNASLLVPYNYTNKTDSAQIPQQIQSAYMILKQDDQQLDATNPTGDSSDLVNNSKNQVQPGKSFDGALLVKLTIPILTLLCTSQISKHVDSFKILKHSN